ncbi:Hypothetical predicted protein [Mytilus galloprovincialis]|uniref:Uncharacterized protein n=1 Tax=Mytilus galloprovincialis TaxID=29158 RepID=A0A8B6H8D1_MYTGA|nr:Hypothetical predicted protein [Mytilus galloprovincialis]
MSTRETAGRKMVKVQRGGDLSRDRVTNKPEGVKEKDSETAGQQGIKEMAGKSPQRKKGITNKKNKEESQRKPRTREDQRMQIRTKRCPYTGMRERMKQRSYKRKKQNQKNKRKGERKGLRGNESTDNRKMVKKTEYCIIKAQREKGVARKYASQHKEEEPRKKRTTHKMQGNGGVTKKERNKGGAKEKHDRSWRGKGSPKGNDIRQGQRTETQSRTGTGKTDEVAPPPPDWKRGGSEHGMNYAPTGRRGDGSRPAT